MNPLQKALVIVSLAGAMVAAGAVVRQAHIGYVYPAGGQRDTTVEVRVGGEYIYGTTAAIVSGTGVTVQVADSRNPADGKASDSKKPKKKKKNQTVLDEVVTLRIALAPDAEPGDREIRLFTPDGLSNPLVFQIGQAPEVREIEPNEKKNTAVSLPELPVEVNGQIRSGDVDLFKFSARMGQQLVIAAAVRALIPYMADAVPGWFQATLTLCDAQGREVAFADDYRFNQDPVLFYQVPADGEYWLGIRDAIYRGREDFVYRIAIGEWPFITSVFPLGAPRGAQPVSVALSGKNLPSNDLRVDVNRDAPGVISLSVHRDGLSSPPVPFAIGCLPEVLEDESATRQTNGQLVVLPVVVNGRIRAPGESDLFRFEGKQGQCVCLEVQARRLGSPLDSCVVLLDRRGVKLKENDDAEDPAQGLLTHQADSELICTLPEDGLYTVKLYDTQGQGGEAYAYRLSLAPPAPDFTLRATPASLSVPKGGSGALTIHAIRRCGFGGEIRLALDAVSAPGCALDGAVIPAGADQLRVTISVPEQNSAAIILPVLRGTAVVNGAPVSHPVTPAEDLMQAFIYRHLVPAREFALAFTKPVAPFRVVPQLGSQGFLNLPLGKEVSFMVKVTRRPGFDGRIRLQLEDPPKGITLRNPGISPDKDSALITVRTEAKAESKLQGNLIFTAIMQMDKNGGGTAAGVTNAPASLASAVSPTNAVAGKAARTGVTNGIPGVVGKGRLGPPRERFAVVMPAVPFRIGERTPNTVTP